MLEVLTESSKIALAPVLTEERITARRSISRRRFIGLAAAALGAAALVGDSVLLEPNRPQLVRQELVLPRWPAAFNGYKIAVLSDFHYDPVFSVHPLRAAVPAVNALQPDLIVLTGDFVSEPSFGQTHRAAAFRAEPCALLLRQMKAPHGLWAVMGNHDAVTDPGLITSILRASGIQVLSNQAMPIEHAGGRFWLSGVDDVLQGNSDLHAALAKVPKEEATVLLAHEPDYADFVSRHPVDLQISGHSHGGQVRLPFLPPFYEPPLARKYIAGLYKVGPLTLYTNRGLGTVGVPIRFDCPPEITLITLRNAVKS
jgi:predicted MPP superfamily phosphohydrolase